MPDNYQTFLVTWSETVNRAAVIVAETESAARQCWIDGDIGVEFEPEVEVVEGNTQFIQVVDVETVEGS